MKGITEKINCWWRTSIEVLWFSLSKRVVYRRKVGQKATSGGRYYKTMCNLHMLLTIGESNLHSNVFWVYARVLKIRQNHCWRPSFKLFNTKLPTYFVCYILMKLIWKNSLIYTKLASRSLNYGRWITCWFKIISKLLNRDRFKENWLEFIDIDWSRILA